MWASEDNPFETLGHRKITRDPSSSVDGRYLSVTVQLKRRAGPSLGWDRLPIDPGPLGRWFRVRYLSLSLSLSFTLSNGIISLWCVERTREIP